MRALGRNAPAAALGVAVALLYLAQVGGPLRLTQGDSVEYLIYAAGLADGQDHGVAGLQPAYPIGYPAVVAAVDTAGLPMPESIRLLNLLAIAAACLAWYHIFRRALGLSAERALLMTVLVPASWSLTALSAFAISDVLFLGLASTALWTYVAVDARPRSVPAWTGALALTAAAVAVRSAGVALLPALAVAAVPPGWKVRVTRRVRSSPVRSLLGAAFLLALLVAVSLPFVHPRYVAEVLGRYGSDGLGAVQWNLDRKLKGMGELLVNTPRTKLELAMPLSAAWVAVRAAGAAALALMAAAFPPIVRRSPVVAAFGLAYMGMMLIWVGSGVRFLLPVLPVLLAAGAVLYGRVRERRATGDRVAGISFALVRVWTAAYVVLGLSALGYGVHLAWSQRGAVPRYAAMYETCLRGDAEAMDGAGRDRAAYWLLRRYSNCVPVVCPQGLEPAPVPPVHRYRRAAPCRPVPGVEGSRQEETARVILSRHPPQPSRESPTP